MEDRIAIPTARCSAIDRTMFDPKSASPADAKRTISDLVKLRADVEHELEMVEAKWLEVNEALKAVE
ncbi:hypothetical protein [Rhizorhabdus histidinilytica]|uniref:hypothetical protein n=1 Tax=Rhizorhabdus histidinilytica TaxID=439228 RepID=UPI001F1C5930|nr:hypothetical protein [Rhizorhabdus histidinilytica]